MKKFIQGIGGGLVAISALWFTGAYDNFVHEVEMDDIYKADAVYASSFLPAETIQAYNQNGSAVDFVTDKRTTSINLGECFKPTVTGYYTNMALPWLNSYPTEKIEKVPCPQ